MAKGRIVVTKENEQVLGWGGPPIKKSVVQHFPIIWERTATASSSLGWFSVLKIST
jgi:hypothetical protein